MPEVTNERLKDLLYSPVVQLEMLQIKEHNDRISVCGKVHKVSGIKYIICYSIIKLMNINFTELIILHSRSKNSTK